MKWLRRKFTDLSQDWQFGILSGIVLLIVAVALVLLTGCASVFDAPQEPTQYIRATSDEPVLGYYFDPPTGLWIMRIPRNQVSGWSPL